MPKMFTASPRSFIENLPFNDSLIEFSIEISFPISSMSSTYKIKNTIELPLNFLYKQESSSLLMKDVGEAIYILGIKIYRDRSRRLLGLSQSTYIDKVLKRFNMSEAKKGFLPLSHGIRLSETQSPSTSDERSRMIRILYASAIGSIMYAMICTRPDVAFAISLTSRYQANPGESHWAAVKTILKYLKRTKEMFLVYGGEEELVVRVTPMLVSKPTEMIVDHSLDSCTS